MRALATLAGGGAGMLLGGLIDFGPLGLSGLLGTCRAWATTFAFWPRPAELWLMSTLMPWACIGMVVGGSAAMLLFHVLHHPRARSLGRLLGYCGLCNAGMLLGMMLAGHVAAHLAFGLRLEVAGALTVGAMLLGMAVGMGALLPLAARVDTAAAR